MTSLNLKGGSRGRGKESRSRTGRRRTSSCSNPSGVGTGSTVMAFRCQGIQDRKKEDWAATGRRKEGWDECEKHSLKKKEERMNSCRDRESREHCLKGVVEELTFHSKRLATENTKREKE